MDNVELSAVKWFDNRGVIIASTFASAQPVSTVKRWGRKLKNKMAVDPQEFFSLYNKFMAGVDALDALVAYYHIHIRSREYHRRFFFHFVEMVIANWQLLYRRDCESLNIPKKKQRDLLSFRTSVAQAPSCRARTCPRRRGDILQQIWKENARRKNTEAHPRPYHHRKSVEMLWVTGQWLKVHVSAAKS